jgi:hypothetical protein
LIRREALASKLPLGEAPGLNAFGAVGIAIDVSAGRMVAGLSVTPGEGQR